MIPIRCRKRGVKFTCQRRNERVCPACKPRWQVAKAAALGGAKDSAHPAIPEPRSSLVFPQARHSDSGPRGSAGGDRADWPGFYREMYTRLGLEAYLPVVLAELTRHGGAQ